LKQVQQAYLDKPELLNHSRVLWRG